MSPTLFEGLHFHIDPPATLGGRCVAPMAKKELGRGNENGIMMTEQHVGRGTISQSFSSTSASGSLVDGSGAFMTESINSALLVEASYHHNRLRSQLLEVGLICPRYSLLSFLVYIVL